MRWFWALSSRFNLKWRLAGSRRLSHLYNGKWQLFIIEKIGCKSCKDLALNQVLNRNMKAFLTFEHITLYFTRLPQFFTDFRYPWTCFLLSLRLFKTSLKLPNAKLGQKIKGNIQVFLQRKMGALSSKSMLKLTSKHRSRFFHGTFNFINYSNWNHCSIFAESHYEVPMKRSNLRARRGI